MVIVLRIVRIANREDPDQTASSEAVWSGSALLVLTLSVSHYPVAVPFSNKITVIYLKISVLCMIVVLRIVRIANGEDPDQTVSSEAI